MRKFGRIQKFMQAWAIGLHKYFQIPSINQDFAACKTTYFINRSIPWGNVFGILKIGNSDTVIYVLLRQILSRPQVKA